MRRIAGFLVMAVLLVGAAALVSSPSASATTQCRDGWTSPSAGGPGTCSWHKGIDYPADYSYSPDLPAAHHSDDGSHPSPWGIAILVGLVGLGGYWFWNSGKTTAASTPTPPGSGLG